MNFVFRHCKDSIQCRDIPACKGFCGLRNFILKNIQKRRTDALCYRPVQSSFSSCILLTLYRSRVKVKMVTVVVPFLMAERRGRTGF